MNRWLLTIVACGVTFSFTFCLGFLHQFLKLFIICLWFLHKLRSAAFFFSFAVWFLKVESCTTGWWKKEQGLWPELVLSGKIISWSQDPVLRCGLVSILRVVWMWWSRLPYGWIFFKGNSLLSVIFYVIKCLVLIYINFGNKHKFIRIILYHHWLLKYPVSDADECPLWHYEPHYWHDPVMEPIYLLFEVENNMSSSLDKGQGTRTIPNSGLLQFVVWWGNLLWCLSKY